MSRSDQEALNGRPRVLFIEWEGSCSGSRELELKNGPQTLIVDSCPRDNASSEHGVLEVHVQETCMGSCPRDKHGVPFNGKWIQMMSNYSEIFRNLFWGDF